MRFLQGAATTELAVTSSVVPGFHAAPSSAAASCTQNSPHLTFGQRNMHRISAVPITLSAESFGIAGAPAVPRAYGINNQPGIITLARSKLGGLWGGKEGFGVGWSTGLGSRFVGGSNLEKGQFGFLMDSVNNSTVCSQCWTRFSDGLFACLSSTTTGYGGGGGKGIDGRGAGGRGGGGGDGFEARASGEAAAVGGEQSDELPVGLSGDEVIILDVGNNYPDHREASYSDEQQIVLKVACAKLCRPWAAPLRERSGLECSMGMSCGGCSASVKRILESQPQVSLANVNLATETAFVQISFDGQAQTDRATLKQEIGELLAKHLTSCGFKSTVREVT